MKPDGIRYPALQIPHQANLTTALHDVLTGKTPLQHTKSELQSANRVEAVSKYALRQPQMESVSLDTAAVAREDDLGFEDVEERVLAVAAAAEADDDDCDAE